MLHWGQFPDQGGDAQVVEVTTSSQPCPGAMKLRLTQRLMSPSKRRYLALTRSVSSLACSRSEPSHVSAGAVLLSAPEQMTALAGVLNIACSGLVLSFAPYSFHLADGRCRPRTQQSDTAEPALSSCPDTIGGPGFVIVRTPTPRSLADVGKLRPKGWPTFGDLLRLPLEGDQ